MLDTKVAYFKSIYFKSYIAVEEAINSVPSDSKDKSNTF